MAKKKKQGFLQLDDRKLSEQWLFRLSILIPFITSIILCIPLWLETNIDFSSKGYDIFLNLYKLPMGVLSLSIPLVAIVAHIHRTIQTAEQIQSSRRKNTTDSFFAHHKFMIEAFGNIPKKTLRVGHEDIEYGINDSYLLYDNLFRGSSYENGISVERLNTITDKLVDGLNEINKRLIELRTLSFDEANNILALTQILHSIYNIESELSIIIPPKRINNLAVAKNDHFTVMIVTEHNNEDQLKERIENLLFIIKKIFQIINKHFDIDDVIVFYSQIKESRYYFLRDTFDNMVLTEQKKQRSFASKASNSLEEAYNDYKHSLAKKNAPRPSLFKSTTK
ncbi:MULTISPECIES: hypothetical protein [unclassified Serratia (in: enterobacteria)]|uniref:hypothetical protein n=1 Tax=unclassified Serratia (in: enterobacteria) TaxID=2647522 RepID=UPI002117E5CD|nr:MULTISPECIES: hypothetical protein [unclassified Serratia (in: enterobacteria)]